MIGLSHTDASLSFDTIQFAIFLADGGGALLVYENGVGIGTFGTYTTGDKLRVEVSGAKVVTYKKNGTTFYTSLVAAGAYPLFVDTALRDVGATLQSVILFGR